MFASGSVVGKSAAPPPALLGNFALLSKSLLNFCSRLKINLVLKDVGKFTKPRSTKYLNGIL